MAQPLITTEDFMKFREFFYRKTGIYFDESKRYFVDKRLAERVRESGSENFRTYFTMLRFQASGEELQQLVNDMTVNETYFFRESYQFDCLVNSMLEEVAAHKKPGDTIRIWSIPSSSGEEPYSIAIFLLELWPKIEQFDVEILASDIDTSILDSAKQGIYSMRSLQYLPKTYLDRYFEPYSNQRYQIIEDLRQSIEFSRVNLNDRNDTRRFSNIDIIFCRNLLIYFDDISRKDAADTFYDSLNHGGFICLGHSESMSRISPLFTVRKFPDAIVYQKPRFG